jgi:hypothetical protein
MYEGAGLAHVSHPAGIAKAAITAKLLGWPNSASGHGAGPFVGGKLQ